MRKYKRKQKIVLLALLMVGVVISGWGIRYLMRTHRYQEAMQQLKIHEVDLSKVEDGEYIGTHDVDFISAKVKVGIKDHSITHIQSIYHKNERGSRAESIIGKIMKEQKIKVDTVSGATNSSKVIQKAVEKALRKK